jgi:hypothetical protein
MAADYTLQEFSMAQARILIVEDDELPSAGRCWSRRWVMPVRESWRAGKTCPAVVRAETGPHSMDIMLKGDGRD